MKFLKTVLPGKWELAGWVLVGIASACFMRAGQNDFAARHVWEEAERIKSDARETER